jgi:hypothetical protein
MALNFKKAIIPFVDWFIGVLSKPGKPVHGADAPNISRYKNDLKLADVVLVSGTARISFVVKALTLSPWSHVVLFVGNRRDLLTEDEIKEWTDLYGEESIEYLVLDADPLRKVHLRPLDDYNRYMLRLCRPEALTKTDRKKVVDHALGQLKKHYDVSHIIRLLFFFAIPWELFPQGVRRFITDFSLSEHDTICSRVLAEAFESVGYPIRPTYIEYGQGSLSTGALRISKGLRYRSKTAFRLLRGGKVTSAFTRLVSERYTEIHLRGARHVTPADYDLSRFFSVVKDTQDLSIDYWNAKTSCAINVNDSESE